MSSISAPLVSAQENNPNAAMPVTSPDGTVTALIPQGWQPFIFQEGVFAASGPNNAQVTKEQTFIFIDPRGMNASQHMAPLVPFTNDVGQAFKLAMNARAKNSQIGHAEVFIEKLTQLPSPNMPGLNAATISGTMTSSRGLEKFEALAGVSVINKRGGGWCVSVSMIEAPTATFENSKPTMMAIYSSYHVNQNVRQIQVQKNIANSAQQSAAGREMLARTRARNTAVVNASMDNTANSQDAIDKSTAGFVRHLRGTTTVENTATGAHSQMDAGAADSLTSTNSNFRQVPTKQMIKGVDY
ncbi:MAG: hypothetical protein P4L53_01710 [Candidatus Obscuribacterales bacterium]|nr:hypothetical protein [Candidatus Obscuribacterales bacterium]